MFFIVNYELTLNANFFSHSELILKLTEDKVHFSAYEIVGDIVHLNLTEEQEQYKKIIADAIFFKTGKTVINKTGNIQENFRFYKSDYYQNYSLNIILDKPKQKFHNP